MDASPFSSSSKIEMSQLLLQLRVARAWVANKGDSRKGIRHPPTLLITIRHPGLQKPDDTNNQSKLKYFNVVWMKSEFSWAVIEVCWYLWWPWQILGMVTNIRYGDKYQVWWHAWIAKVRVSSPISIAFRQQERIELSRWIEWSVDWTSVTLIKIWI